MILLMPVILQLRIIMRRSLFQRYILKIETTTAHDSNRGLFSTFHFQIYGSFATLRLLRMTKNIAIALPFSIFHFPFSIFHFQLSIFNFQFSIFHFQFSIFNFPFSIFSISHLILLSDLYAMSLSFNSSSFSSFLFSLN